jgi:hypothetical protein
MIIISTVWVSFLLFYLAKFFNSTLDQYLTYGKHNTHKGETSTSKEKSLLQKCWDALVVTPIVHEAYVYLLAYMFAWMFNGLCWWFFVFSREGLFTYKIFIFAAYQTHLTRRVLECLFVHKSTDKFVPLVLFLAVLLFYSLSCLTISTSCAFSLPNNITILAVLRMIIGISLFAIGNYHQHKAHVILANLRSTNAIKQYFIPYGDWFEYVSCPHYLAEILLYFSMMIMVPSSINMWGLWSFVTINLTSTGINTHAWYKNKFGNEYPKRRAVFPFVL